MTMWPISTRVNSRKNDDAQLLEAIELATEDLPTGSSPPAPEILRQMK